MSKTFSSIFRFKHSLLLLKQTTEVDVLMGLQDLKIHVTATLSNLILEQQHVYPEIKLQCYTWSNSTTY